MRPWARRLVGGGLASVVIIFQVGVAEAEVVVAQAAVVDADGERISGGHRQTEFTFQLEGRPECPGDSFFDNWRVQSYMVPVAVAAAEVTYDGLGPTPYGYETYESFRQPLYGVDSNPFAGMATATPEREGEPGQIIDVPMFDFAVYGPGDVPAGRYRIGLACTLLNEVERVWDTEIEITAGPADDPPLQWEVVGAEAEAESQVGPMTLVAFGGVAAVVGGLLFFGRAKRRDPSSTARRS